MDPPHGVPPVDPPPVDPPPVDPPLEDPPLELPPLLELELVPVELPPEEPAATWHWPLASSPLCEQQSPGHPLGGETPSGTQQTREPKAIEHSAPVSQQTDPWAHASPICAQVPAPLLEAAPEEVLPPEEEEEEEEEEELDEGAGPPSPVSPPAAKQPALARATRAASQRRLLNRNPRARIDMENLTGQARHTLAEPRRQVLERRRWPAFAYAPRPGATSRRVRWLLSALLAATPACSTCIQDSDCPSGDYCDFTATGCGNGVSTISGATCRPNRDTNGGACSVDSDCTETEACGGIFANGEGRVGCDETDPCPGGTCGGDGILCLSDGPPSCPSGCVLTNAPHRSCGDGFPICVCPGNVCTPP